MPLLSKVLKSLTSSSRTPFKAGFTDQVNPSLFNLLPMEDRLQLLGTMRTFPRDSLAIIVERLAVAALMLVFTASLFQLETLRDSKPYLTTP